MDVDAWAAGFFEGEGCIVTNKHYDGSPCIWKLPVVQCSQNSKGRAALRRLRDHYGGSVRSSGSKEELHWQVHKADEAVDFLRRIRPHLSFRRELIDAALMSYQTISQPGQPVGEEMIRLREMSIRKIRQINNHQL